MCFSLFHSYRCLTWHWAVLLIAGLWLPSPLSAEALASFGTMPPVGHGDHCRWTEGFHTDQVTDRVNDSVPFDDGSGPALFLAGRFAAAGPVMSQGLVKWDGNSWSNTPGSFSCCGYVQTFGNIEVFDDGSGSRIYAFGRFELADGSEVRHLATWDGSQFQPVVPDNSIVLEVDAMTTVDLGNGPRLAIAGNFFGSEFSQQPLALWDGQSLINISQDFQLNGLRPNHIAAFDDGGGETLFAVEHGSSPHLLKKWQVDRWVSVTSLPSQNIQAMAVMDLGQGPRLVLAGHRAASPGNTFLDVWDGSQWAVLGVVAGGDVTDMMVSTVDGSAKLFVVGSFSSVEGVAADSIAAWDGQSWSAVGSGFDGNLLTISEVQEAAGPVLYVGGFLLSNCDRVARWDGQAWSKLVDPSAGKGFEAPGPRAITVHDDGNGDRLYLAGNLVLPGRDSSQSLAIWQGSDWADHPDPLNERVDSMISFDDGSGSALYVSGFFTGTEAGQALANVAKWDGTSWSSMGGGLDRIANDFEIFDDGGGARLFAASTAFLSTTLEPWVGKWDGGAWIPIVTAGGDSGFVFDLAVFDAGGGPELYAAGDFSQIGGVSANNIARWNGTTWFPWPAGSMILWPPWRYTTTAQVLPFTSAGALRGPTARQQNESPAGTARVGARWGASTTVR